MNKCLILLTGLATLTLTYSPAALANPSWSPAHRTSPAPLLPSGSAVLPEVRSEVGSGIQAGIQAGIQDSIQADLQPDVQPNPQPETYPNTQKTPENLPSLPKAPLPLDPPIANRQLPARTTPANQEGYIPLAPAAPASSVTQAATPIQSNLGLQFDLSTSAARRETSRPTPPPAPPSIPPLPAVSESAPAPPLPSPTPVLPSQAKPTDFTLGDLFAGGSDSLVAIVVGNAEGTRSPDGKPNENFHGHPDPGNGVWNLGTFSYQHGAASPEEADEKQLKRLRQQAKVIQEKATANGLKLTLEETLNGIDLANQAPKAVIDGEGYVEWLAKAHQMSKHGDDAILWARVQSFIDPKTQRWDAPGLGNTAEKIIHDQQRRMKAIDRAIAAQNYQIASDARLRSQPIGFRLPRWNFPGQIIQKVATLFY